MSLLARRNASRLPRRVLVVRLLTLAVATALARAGHA